MSWQSGVLPLQCLRHAIETGWIVAPTIPLETRQLQPASLDLRLGTVAYRLRSSFLPGFDTVEKKLSALAMYDIPLAPSAVLERGHVYLIPLLETLALPKTLRAKANPKSSTGRLDIFTRVITDAQQRFDDIRAGYTGPLYLEVFPRSFPLRVHQGLSLNQLRLFQGTAILDDANLRRLYAQTPLLYDTADQPLPLETLTLEGGLFLSVATAARDGEIIGYKARQNSDLIDLSNIAFYHPAAFWEPVRYEQARPLILEPEEFYLLASKEKVRIPPDYAAELMAYDAGSGELRAHYAGFFDPGFGDDNGRRCGTKAVLEVRPHDVPFLVEDGQLFCKLLIERMVATPEVTYGAALASSYQTQTLTLSKQFLPWGASPRQRLEALF